MTSKSALINLSITFRNMEATDAIRSYAEEKITNCLLKFIQSDTEGHVVLRVEKNRQIAEISFHSGSTNITAKEESEDLYAAIDLLVDNLTRQLRKHKEKVTRKH